MAPVACLPPCAITISEDVHVAAISQWPCGMPHQPVDRSTINRFSVGPSINPSISPSIHPSITKHAVCCATFTHPTRQASLEPAADFDLDQISHHSWLSASVSTEKHWKVGTHILKGLPRIEPSSKRSTAKGWHKKIQLVYCPPITARCCWRPPKINPASNGRCHAFRPPYE
jgi:hypothetical protein